MVEANGRGNDKLVDCFRKMYDLQLKNQKALIDSGSYDHFSEEDRTNLSRLPIDDPQLMSYHVQQLMSEIGELLEADKRWKNFRNVKYDRKKKLLELSDCFIVLLNIAMFSGFDANELEEAIFVKIGIVDDRIHHVVRSGLGRK